MEAYLLDVFLVCRGRTTSSPRSHLVMHRTYQRVAVVFASLALAACSDSSTAPRAASSRPAARSSGPTFDLSGGNARGTQGSDFTVTAKGGSFSVNGLFSVNFPANSICAAGSTYGPTEWDAPCATLGADESVQIHAMLVITSNGVALDFSPQLRFSPDASVILSTAVFAPQLKANKEYLARNPGALQPLAISYLPVVGGTPVRDYVSDPSLVTHVDLETGIIWRRAKHFSGYVIASGECDPAVTTCP